VLWTLSSLWLSALVLDDVDNDDDDEDEDVTCAGMAAAARVEDSDDENTCVGAANGDPTYGAVPMDDDADAVETMVADDDGTWSETDKLETLL